VCSLRDRCSTRCCVVMTFLFFPLVPTCSEIMGIFKPQMALLMPLASQLWSLSFFFPFRRQGRKLLLEVCDVHLIFSLFVQSLRLTFHRHLDAYVGVVPCFFPLIKFFLWAQRLFKHHFPLLHFGGPSPFPHFSHFDLTISNSFFQPRYSAERRVLKFSPTPPRPPEINLLFRPSLFRV